MATATNPKLETATATALRERLPIKPTYATVDYIGQRTKRVILEMDETGLTLQDIMDDGKLLRLLQQDRQRALSEDDRVEFRWFNMRAYAIVDFADNTEVRFMKPDIKNRSERDRIPWQNANYEVRPVAGGWCYFRKPDKFNPSGVRMSTALWPTWESARAACERDQASTRV